MSAATPTGRDPLTRRERASQTPPGGSLGRLGGVIASALLGWLGGALPWLAHGAALPISPAWPTYAAGHTPWIPMPFGEYEPASLTICAFVGGACGLLVSRVLRQPLWTGAVGALLGVGLAIMRCWFVVHTHLHAGAASGILVDALVVAGGTGLVLGVLSAVGMRLRFAWTRALGGGLVAAVVPQWLILLIVTDAATAPQWQIGLAHQSVWLFALLLATTFVWVHWRPVAWLAASALAWLVPPTVTALNYPALTVRAGSNSSAGVAAIISGTWGIFTHGLSPAVQSPAPYVVAWALAAVLLFAAAKWHVEHATKDTAAR